LSIETLAVSKDFLCLKKALELSLEEQSDYKDSLFCLLHSNRQYKAFSQMCLFKGFISSA